jgi:hypothetical protein
MMRDICVEVNKLINILIFNRFFLHIARLMQTQIHTEPPPHPPTLQCGEGRVGRREPKGVESEGENERGPSQRGRNRGDGQ